MVLSGGCLAAPATMIRPAPLARLNLQAIQGQIEANLKQGLPGNRVDETATRFCSPRPRPHRTATSLVHQTNVRRRCRVQILISLYYCLCSTVQVLFRVSFRYGQGLCTIMYIPESANGLPRARHLRPSPFRRLSQ